MPIFIDRNSYFAIVIVAVITKLHYAAIVIAAVIIVERVATLDIVILTNLTQFVIGQF